MQTLELDSSMPLETTRQAASDPNWWMVLIALIGGATAFLRWLFGIHRSFVLLAERMESLEKREVDRDRERRAIDRKLTALWHHGTGTDWEEYERGSCDEDN